MCSTTPVHPTSANTQGIVYQDDPSSDVVDKLSHLEVTPTRHHIAPSNPASKRAQKLKTLPGIEDVKDVVSKSMKLWGKSFELTEQEFSFEDLEPTEALKNKTNSELIQKQFEAVVNFSVGVTSCFAEFQELRKPFDDLVSAKNTTVSQQAEAAIKLREGLEQNADKLGQNANIILSSYNDIWEFQSTSVKETQDKIESILRAEHDHQEDIQFAIDLLKDGERIAPKVKEPSGLVAASLEGVAKYGFLKLAQRRKKKLLESTMRQATYQGEKSKADALNKKLDESKESLDNAFVISLSVLGAPLYFNTLVVIDEVNLGENNTSFVAIAKQLDETEGKLLTLIELLENFLAQITQDYGSKFSTQKFKRLCSRVPSIFTALDMLLSAKDVVVDDYQHIYEKHIYEICAAILGHFDNMKEVYWECKGAAMSVERQATFLSDDVPNFIESVIPHLRAIGDIAQAHISKAKSNEAIKKRRKEDMYHENDALTRPGRSLVTGDEITWALYKVIDALLLIKAVSRASDACDTCMGKISPVLTLYLPGICQVLPCLHWISSKKASGTDDTAANGMEDMATKGEKHTAANGSLEWFKMPEEMINQFYAVLFAEAKKLHFLKNKGERQMNSHEEAEPGGLLSRLRRLMARKPQ